MTGRAVLWVIPTTSTTDFALMVLFGVIGALLPDLNAPVSKLSTTSVIGIRPQVLRSLDRRVAPVL